MSLASTMMSLNHVVYPIVFFTLVTLFTGNFLVAIAGESNQGAVDGRCHQSRASVTLGLFCLDPLPIGRAWQSNESLPSPCP